MPRVGLSPRSLTETAAELADAEGLEAVSVASVARRVGVAAPSLYAHIDGADDLRRRVGLLALAEIADRMAEALAGRSGKEAVAAFVDTIREYARQHPGRYAASRGRLDAESAALSEGPRTAALVRGILRGYGVPEGAESDHAIRIIGGLVHGVADLEASGSFDHSAASMEQSWSRVVDALDVVLADWPGRGGR